MSYFVMLHIAMLVIFTQYIITSIIKPMCYLMTYYHSYSTIIQRSKITYNNENI